MGEDIAVKRIGKADATGAERREVEVLIAGYVKRHEPMLCFVVLGCEVAIPSQHRALFWFR